MTNKPEKRPATEAELAALNFEPWQGPIDYEKLPTNEQFIQYGLGHLATCRLALVAMYKTKAELGEIHGKMDNETGLALMNGYIAAKSFFSCFSEILDAAEARILVAGSSYLQGIAVADRSLRKIVRNRERNNA